MTITSQLKRNTPEAEGISSLAILDFIQAIEQHPSHPLDALHGFMLLRHGSVVAEGWWAPYERRSPHTLYSLSKSFTSTAIGMAVAEGLLTTDDPVLKFFPEDAPPNPSENLKAMRVRHLLSMNTGHKEDTTERVFQDHHQRNLFGLVSHHEEDTHGSEFGKEDSNWPRVFLSLPVEYPPGTWFVYNTAATYMLSAIITKLTGETVLDYLRPRLFNPLGIENPTWESDPRGINLGGTGLHIETEAIARFGQMYLQKGMWEGQRILAEEWIAEATKATSDNSNTQTNPDWTVGYGYQFWRCRHNCYRGDGAFGQYCIIMPEQEVVLAIVGGVRDMQVVLDKVWDHLLPAMQPQALPVDSQAYDKLRNKLTGLSLPTTQGGLSSPEVERCSGKIYDLEQNELLFENISIEFADQGSTLIVRDERGEHTIQVGFDNWQRGTTNMRGHGDESIAACGAWIAEDTYEVRICFYESEICPVFRFHYTSDGLLVEVEPNVSWGPTTTRKITGRWH